MRDAMLRPSFSIAALTLALSACASIPSSSGAGVMSPVAICNAGPAAWSVGKLAHADVVERVRNDSHSRVVRLLKPGQMVTMEFSAERVDIRVDGSNVILAVNCG